MNEALRLAKQMDKEQLRTVKLDIMHSEAAAELRRLDSVNKELLELLEDVISIGGGMVEEIYGYWFVEQVRAAIAKVKGDNHDQC